LWPGLCPRTHHWGAYSALSDIYLYLMDPLRFEAEKNGRVERAEKGRRRMERQGKG